MKKVILFCLFLTLLSCKDAIKNEVEVENEIIEDKLSNYNLPKATENLNINNKEDLLGYWVGYFMPFNEDEKHQKSYYGDEGMYWERENKINISIDEIIGDSIKGHSVVAGNDRPFFGKIIETDIEYTIEVFEPGDDKYDGKFFIQVIKKDSLVNGTWESYKKIDISKRKYTLSKKHFKYNPLQMLERVRSYANWDKTKEKKYKVGDGDYLDEEVTKEFSTATDKIYEINASAKILTKTDVENLSKGDLLVLRNTIYARHGYSFKKRFLRVFFDAQPWYIPVHTNIKANFSDIELKNIELLLKYEKNAKEYYDRFGRG